MNILRAHMWAARLTGIMVLVLAATPSFALWKSTGSLRSARAGHTATLLTSAYVLAAGGTNNNLPLAYKRTCRGAFGPTRGWEAMMALIEAT